MSSYAPGQPSHYYTDDSQHDVYHDPPFDPYSNHRPHDSYDQAGYREPYTDEPQYPMEPTQSTEPLGRGAKEDAPFDVEEFNVNPRQGGSSKLRTWRYQNQGGNIWNRGSRPRCFFRFICCTFLIAIFLIISIVLSLALWIEPPDIVVGGDGNSVPVITQGIQVVGNGLQVNLGLPVEVINPNYFSAKLTSVTAQIFYPINNTLVGNGTLHNVKLPAHSNTNFTFPFSIDYTESIDPNNAIITDIASRCLGSPQGDLRVNYKLKVGIHVFFLTISPTISNSLSFACPISSSDIEDLLKQLGIGSTGSGTGTRAETAAGQ
ncbi:hypothetical protein BC834DRAFT_853384 [Gloeopeniophorella convolvens]|nr:hypothetical protein BC834DRAFT_853384 [Gloeopeniophorella convolvens]